MSIQTQPNRKLSADDWTEIASGVTEVEVALLTTGTATIHVAASKPAAKVRDGYEIREGGEKVVAGLTTEKVFARGSGDSTPTIAVRTTTA